MAMMEIIPLDEQSEKMVVALMNGEHPDAIRLYAKHFGGKGSVKQATLLHVDNDKMKVRYTCSKGKQGEVTIPYVDETGASVKVRTVGDCRRTLVGMARQASEALGEHIVLPEVKKTDVPGSQDATAQSSGAPPPEGMAEMLKMMQELKRKIDEEQPMQNGAEAGESTSSGGYTSIPGTGVRTFSATGGDAAPTESNVFKGEGCRLGSSSADSSSGIDSNTEVLPLREVDPEKPIVRLRVQLLDRKPANVTVNRDFTIKDLRAWLQHHQESPSPQRFNLMDVTGFPPKKLDDMSATIEQLNLSKDSSLACRPA